MPGIPARRAVRYGQVFRDDRDKEIVMAVDQETVVVLSSPHRPKTVGNTEYRPVGDIHPGSGVREWHLLGDNDGLRE